MTFLETQAAGEQAASVVANVKKNAEAVIIAERLVKDTSWLPKYVRIEQPNGNIGTSLESMDDIEDDGEIDPSETGDFDAGDFEEAAE